MSTDDNNPITFNDISDEVMVEIINYLVDFKDIANVGLVEKDYQS